MFAQIRQYISGVRTEISRVSWPKKSEVISFTILIFILVVILTTYIWGIDTIVAALITSLMRI
ncbi:preprotein translocase subunit SecE [Candidatus Acetothermia bacterium]|jgi:preprotein translocase subunit SecE|nr:preprotein translocase subunit SecE [Candidatus Acetothermia bacterium]MCI2427363.1 preprotein translocase subunit SecE [Candidatus Acetothermia bacterium]MCI2428368.1 preprotein translocase subunit SecE [Candidatus Acetothermia bacterium]